MKIRIFIVVFFTLYFSTELFCQELNIPDSLSKKLLIATGENKADLLNGISNSFLRTSPQKTIEYAKKALDLSSSINYKKGVGDAYNLLGIANYYSGQFAYALTNYKSSLSVREKLHDKKNIASSLNNIGLVYNQLGDYKQALEYGLKSLKLRLEIGDKYNIGVSYLNVGTVYYFINDFNSSLNQYKAALDIMNSLKEEKVILIILTYIGNIYRDLLKPEKALDYYDQSIKLSEKLNDKKGMADAYQSKANTLVTIKKFNSALEYYKKSLQIYLQLGDKSAIANAYNNTANAYKYLGNYKEMKPLLDKGLKLSLSVNAKPVMQDSYEYLSEYYEAVNDFPNALKYFKKSTEIKDTLFNEGSNKQIEELKTSYETEQKELAITKLQHEKQIQDKELEVQNIWKISLAVGLILAAILLFVLYNRYNLKKKSEIKIKQQNQEILSQQIVLEKQSAEIQDANEELKIKNIALENLNDEKDLFLGIAAHDLKNPLTSIIIDATTVKLYQEKNKTEEINRKMDEIESTAKRMKDIVTKLLDLNSIESRKLNLVMSQFDLVVLLKVITEEYKKQAEAKGIKLYFNSYLNSLQITSDKNVIAQIIDNLISNAIKFSDHGKNVFIEILRDNQKSIISIKDEGPGFKEGEKNNLFKRFAKFSAKPTGGENSTGLGLSIAKTLVEMLNGNIWCESESKSGSKFFIELPI